MCFMGLQSAYDCFDGTLLWQALARLEHHLRLQHQPENPTMR